MDFLELAKNRYSCRSFSNKPVEQEKLDLILEAGRVAPTACNIQPQRILVLQNEDLLKLSNCTKYGWNAPTVLIICYDKDVSFKRRNDEMDFGYIDTSIVTTQMMLEISNLGLGTTWIGAFDSEKTRATYNIPSNYEIVAILPIGYPSENATPSTLHENREPIEKTVFYGKF
jgi:nitroreductase